MACARTQGAGLRQDAAGSSPAAGGSARAQRLQGGWVWCRSLGKVSSDSTFSVKSKGHQPGKSEEGEEVLES